VHILLVGLNHRTAPVQIREQLAFSDCNLRMALEELNHSSGAIPPRLAPPSRPPATQEATLRESTLQEGVIESVILSTCNRLEIYAVAPAIQAGWTAVERFLSRVQGIPQEELRPHLYRLADDQAVEHLMRVACGLDSQILGEAQILGQVNQAFQTAQRAGNTGPILSHLFAYALHAGKRARHETPLGRTVTSVSHAAVKLARAIAGDLAHKRVLLVGAGAIMETTVKALDHHQVQEIACINRTYARAEALARLAGGRAFNWRHLPQALAWADVVITGTSAPHTVIHAPEVESILPQRQGRPLVFVDIAVPRDVAQEVEKLPLVQRQDIDDLQASLDENLAQRQAAIPAVEGIIQEEVAHFQGWQRGRQVVPVVVALRQQIQALAQAELEQALAQMPDLAPREEQIVTKLVHRLVNKILHQPTVRLKARAAQGDGPEYAQALSHLFALAEMEPREHRPSNHNGASTIPPAPTPSTPGRQHRPEGSRMSVSRNGRSVHDVP